MQVDETASGLIYGWNLANANGINVYYPDIYNKQTVRILKYEVKQERDVVLFKKCDPRNNYHFNSYLRDKLKRDLDVCCS
jgi:hypothetical protein